MPLVKVQTSVKPGRDVKEATAKELSALVAERIGKPEVYVAAVLEDDAVVTFGGKVGPGAFVEVRSIGGLNAQVNAELAAAICDCLQARLGIEPSKVYINFADVAAGDWGWNGSTFG